MKNDLVKYYKNNDIYDKLYISSLCKKLDICNIISSGI